MEKKTIVCRCEDIALEAIRKLIHGGCASLDTIKRISRAGMGPCQGRTCREHGIKELARATKGPIPEIDRTTFRPPTKPLNIGSLVGAEENEA